VMAGAERDPPPRARDGAKVYSVDLRCLEPADLCWAPRTAGVPSHQKRTPCSSRTECDLRTVELLERAGRMSADELQEDAAGAHPNTNDATRWRLAGRSFLSTGSGYHAAVTRARRAPSPSSATMRKKSAEKGTPAHEAICGGAGMPCPVCNEPHDGERPYMGDDFVPAVDRDKGLVH
jgi:hypothetical protein